MDIARAITALQTNATQAKDDINQRLENLSTQSAMGRIPSAMTIEALYEAHNVARLWNQIISATSKGVQAEDMDQVVQALRTWYDEAQDQIMSPGHSGSTSLVRTAEMIAEMEALKIVARRVTYMIRSFTS